MTLAAHFRLGVKPAGTVTEEVMIACLLGMNLFGAPGSPLGFWLAVGATGLSSIATLDGLKWAGVFK